MTDELATLLEKAKGLRLTEEQLHEHRIALAVANGALSDSRVTEDAMRATMTVAAASGKPRTDGRGRS